MIVCDHLPLAIRITPRMLSTIASLNGGVTPEIEEAPTFFMIYCYGSDHEETEIISDETYKRTYEELPAHLDAMQVRTID
jgi:hypothetical protein